MKSMLLLCPKFMGYDELLINNLNNEYEINYINTELYLRPARNEYKKNNIIKKIIYKIFPFYKKKYREKLLEKYDDDLFKQLNLKNDYDLILAINGDGLSDLLYKKISNEFRNSKKILYLWDDIDLLFKKSHFKYFDKVSSYNIEDCKKNKFTYQPVFTNEIVLNCKKKYDISIIGTATKERISFAKKIYQKYNQKYSFYIYFYDKNHKFDFFCNDKPLSYDKYQKKLAESRTIIDCARYKQKGPTTRVFDAISTKTKIISSNKELRKYPIYDSNILIIGSNCNIPKEFIESNYEENENRKVTTVEIWFDNIK